MARAFLSTAGSHKNAISAIFCHLVCFLSTHVSAIVLLLHDNRSLKQISAMFRQILKHLISNTVYFTIFSNMPPLHVSPLLCPINFSSSSLYEFGLHYPRVFLYRIVLIQKLKRLNALEGKNNI